MGVNVSKGTPEEISRHRTIEKLLKEDRERSANVFKVLLLGPGDSGKSTIVKQMRILHAGGFTGVEIMHQKSLVFENVLVSMAALIKAMGTLQIDYEHAANEIAADLILKAENNWVQEKQIGVSEWMCIKTLWADRGILKCYSRSNEFQLSDSAKYLQRISSPKYEPTQDDILRVRASTTGIVEISFRLQDSILTIIDVGGQRSQRKKWIHCFEGVDALIFIAAMSEYNQMLYECENTNRMAESLRLFGTTASCRWFRKTPIILFLNKKDLFAEKLSKFPLTMAFPDYKGSQDYEEAALFIQKKFRRRVEVNPESLYIHRTCATDTRNVEFVMGACFDIILTKTLDQVRL